MPDGSHIYVNVLINVNSRESGEFWRLPTENGEPVRTPMAVPHRSMSLSPDGKTVVMTRWEDRLQVSVLKTSCLSLQHASVPESDSGPARVLTCRGAGHQLAPHARIVTDCNTLVTVEPIVDVIGAGAR